MRLFRRRHPDFNSTLHWKRESWLKNYIGVFLLFSAVLHGAGFYLFKVVYPPPARVDKVARSITVLDPSNPAVRSLTQRLHDRTVYLQPASSESGVGVHLQHHTVKFNPEHPTEIPTMIEPDGAELEWQLLTPMISPAPTSSTLSQHRLNLLPPLDQLREAPWSVLTSYLKAVGKLPELRVDLFVDTLGHPAVRQIQGDIDEEAKTELSRLIESSLRFLPPSTNLSGTLVILSAPLNSSTLQ